MKSLVFCVLTLFAATVFADSRRPKREYVETVTTAVLAETAVNAACVADAWDDDTPTCTSFVVKVLGYHQAELYLKFIRGGTATRLHMQCETSQTLLKPWAKIQAGDASIAPIVIMGNREFWWDVSDFGVGLDDTDVFRVSLKLSDFALRCRIWTTGGTADDKAAAWITFGAP
jgi:hypothetical protein